MTSVYISVFWTQGGGVSGHVLTKTVWNRLFWTERVEIHHENDKIHLSRPKDMGPRLAKQAGKAIYDRWVNAGRPSKREMEEMIRARNVLDIKDYRGATTGQSWRNPGIRDGGGGGSTG